MVGFLCIDLTVLRSVVRIYPRLDFHIERGESPALGHAGRSCVMTLLWEK